MMELKNEASYPYPCRVTMEMLGGDGVMKPGGYQTLICDVAETHLHRNGLGEDDLAKYDVAWVLISSTVDILSPIRAEMNLIGHTWHSAQDRLTFRRDLTFTDEAGTPRFHAATFTVLMDRSARRIVRPDRAGFDVGAPHPVFAAEASPKLRVRREMQPCDTRRIYPSHIDCLGHTNNCRYSDFAYDALTEEELHRLPALRRVEMNYLSELRLGDTFTVRRSAPNIENGGLFIDGVNNLTGKQSFACRMTFAQ